MLVQRALRSSGEIRQQLEQLLQGITAEHNHAGVEAGGDPALLATYREACAELGVLPGSSWAVVRATWRRNLKLWHPDQGGDAARWNRRNGAYELLAAWYAFAKSD
mgnify:FL=1